MLYLFHWNFWTQTNIYSVGVCGTLKNRVDAKAHDLRRLGVDDSLKAVRIERNKKSRHKTQTSVKKSGDVRKLFQHKLSKTAQTAQRKNQQILVHQWSDGKFK